MREHSYGVTVLTIISAILLFAFLNFVPEKSEDEKTLVNPSPILPADTDPDYLTEFDKSVFDVDAIPVELSFSSAYQEDNFSAGGGILTIKKGGTYLLTGMGLQVIVDAGEEVPVHLILSDFTITSTDGPAIYAPSCSKLLITLADGTFNEISDSVLYSQYRGIARGCIHCRNSITFNGEGALRVNAYNSAGIFSKDNVKIVSGNIEIAAVGQGIYAEDKFVMYDGDLHIESENEGIVSARTGVVDKGYVDIKNGNVTIESDAAGIRAVTKISEGENASVSISTEADEYVIGAPADDEEESVER